MRRTILLVLVSMISLQCKEGSKALKDEEKVKVVEKEWKSIFNGTDLTGWTPKFAGSELGVNYKNTFRVEDGLIKVRYEAYDRFNNEFGHLFYETPYSSYKLRLEYRFLEGQATDGPGWAFKNSGVMYHAQDPKTMGVDQSFPICLEGQFLGGGEEGERPTGNLCTPSTHVTIDGEFTETHCLESTSDTYRDDQWVKAELVIFGSEIAHHIINGDTVFTFTSPVYGGEDITELVPFKDGDPVKGGYFALQAESHPLDFRNIEILDLGRVENE